MSDDLDIGKLGCVSNQPIKRFQEVKSELDSEDSWQSCGMKKLNNEFEELKH